MRPDRARLALFCEALTVAALLAALAGLMAGWTHVSGAAVAVAVAAFFLCVYLAPRPPRPPAAQGGSPTGRAGRRRRARANARPANRRGAAAPAVPRQPPGR